jgi:hypothetical protein
MISRYKNKSAASAWFWVDALTCRSTASAVRNPVISGGPISAGWRVFIHALLAEAPARTSATRYTGLFCDS